MGKEKIINPYKSQKSHLFRIKGSVLLNVLSSAIFITAFSAVIVVLFQMSPVKLAIPISLITVLGLVVGLLLTYRTNTAYDRYWEGRKLWSTMVTSIRNLTRCIWVHIDDDNDENVKSEKKAAINLLASFAVAVKHELREENGCQYHDLVPVIPSNILSQLTGYVKDGEIIEIKGKKLSLWDQFMHRTYKPHLSHDKEVTSDSNIPLEISLFISAYIHYNAKEKKIDSPLVSNMLASVNVLVDCLSQFERVLRSPIPLAYSIHLAQTVWVYCLSLPFQLVGQANYATIPIVFFASMVLIGIERIGAEIENPFGYDENDLPLDDFCKHIKDELDGIISSSIRYEPPSLDSLKEIKNDDSRIVDIE
nr:9854_t:CDS:2 [Entrophospora candida]